MARFVCSGYDYQCPHGPCDAQTSGKIPTHCCFGYSRPRYEVDTMRDGVILDTFDGKVIPDGIEQIVYATWTQKDRREFILGSVSPCLSVNCDNIDCDECILHNTAAGTTIRSRWMDKIFDRHDGE